MAGRAPGHLDIVEDVAQHAPSLARSFELIDRDTIWSPDASIGMESFHIGMGLTPNPLVGAANRYYLTSRHQVERILNWSITRFNADPNQIHWKGRAWAPGAGPRPASA